MTPAELRDFMQEFERVDKREDFILEKDNGKYRCDVWDDTCHKHLSMWQPTLALAISLVLKKASEGK